MGTKQWMVSRMKQYVAHFSSGDRDVKDKDILDGHPVFHKHSIQALAHHWQKCRVNSDHYVGKNRVAEN